MAAIIKLVTNRHNKMKSSKSKGINHNAGGLVNMEDAACSRLAELMLNVEEVCTVPGTACAYTRSDCLSPLCDRSCI